MPRKDPREELDDLLSEYCCAAQAGLMTLPLIALLLVLLALFLVLAVS